ncbi:GatB/YqeY domain-containing protein [candidate division WWE3 bacterium]|uniref:GatB/YqeY domain-containing protein n=1 Tax=candidate division WWE3 bacterium TaxID=2053526 RepID=A0A7X9HGY2_UNCKA|nr:GatB/YqeY domain-containing protein [candidate division WWE3 bacterium]
MILEQLKTMQTDYLKSKDMPRLGVLRYFISQIQNKEIELRPQKQELTDEVIFRVLKKIIKQKNESIELAKKADRDSVVASEEAELAILKDLVKLFPEELQVQI